MKRICRSIIALTMAVMMLASIAALANATEAKIGIGIVTTGKLRLRAAASTDSEIIGTASKGDAVVIIREVGDWYLVNCNLEIGYMHKDYIEFNEKKNVKLGYAQFDVTSNVRKGPGTDTDIVAQAPRNETCFIIGFNTGWYKVSYEGQIGYVRSDLLTLLEKPYTNAGSPGNTYKEDKDNKPAASTASTETAAPAASTASSNSSSTSSSSTSSDTSSSDASASAASTASSTGSASASESSDLGQRIATYAQKFLGYKYVYGGNSPSTGFDCSGLTSYVAKQFGYSIGRTANAQLSAGTYVSRSDLKPGDIVLFERTYTSSERATHAGIYIGDGKFVHAANSRKGVIISSLDETYYSTRFICGRRLG